MATKIIKAWINGTVQEIEVEDIISPAQPLSVDERVEKLEDKHEVIIADGNFLVGNGTEELEEMTPDEVLSHINGASVAPMTTAEFEAMTDEEVNANTLYMITDVEEESELFTNKTQDIETDKESEEKYPSAKAVYDFVNQSEHITKITETNVYIWDLAPGIYTFTATNKIQRIYFTRGVNHPCDEGAFLIVGGENYSGNLPTATTFKKSVIFLKNLNTTMAQIIAGISTVTYTTAEDGTVTYTAEWDGGIIESQDNKTNVVNESVTNDQYPSALAVYNYVGDYGKNIEEYSKTHFANALKKNVSAVTNLEINDMSPVTHNVVCNLSSRNLSPVETFSEFTNPIEIDLGQTLPAGKYNFLITEVGDRLSFPIEIYNDAGSIVDNFGIYSGDNITYSATSSFNKIIIRMPESNPDISNLNFSLNMSDFSPITVTVNGQDTYTPSIQGVVSGITSIEGSTNMTISTDIDGIEINTEYNADVNQTIHSLEEMTDNAITKNNIEAEVFVGEEFENDKVYNANAINNVLLTFNDILNDFNDRISALEGDYAQAINLVGGAE